MATVQHSIHLLWAEHHRSIKHCKAVRHTVSADDAVALALHLRLSNDQLRKLRRWSNEWKYLLRQRGRQGK